MSYTIIFDINNIGCLLKLVFIKSFIEKSIKIFKYVYNTGGPSLGTLL